MDRRPGTPRRAIAVLAVLLLGLPPAAAQERVVYRIPITGTIEHGLAPYVARSLREAQANGAAAAYLDIDTPGGRVDAAERIADAVRAAPFPVYAYVNPRAFSAGAMVALASDGIYMRPGGVLGAATPVDGQGTKAPEKYVSAMRAEFRALAEEQGLDPRIAEAMVDESLGVPGLVEPGRLLTLSTAEALRIGYARGQPADQAALLRAIGLAGARVVTPGVNWAESLVRFLTDPLVAPLLLSIGLLGILAELKTGAGGIGLAVGLGSLALFFGSNLIVGLAGWEEVILLGLGLIALAVEAFVLPGFGIAGVLGLVALGSALVLAMVGRLPTFTDVLRASAVLGASLLITAAVFVAWLRHLPNSGRFAGFLLRSATASDQGFLAAPVRHDLVGREGVALTDLRPAGLATVGDERLDVVTEGEFVASGSRVRVVRSEGYRHVVRPA
ncbi:MAG TPA: NfeD family protein [Gemmatimonadales bacterium]|nr:NfeD family protein [Gemmatimonadales bacterium]